MWQRWQDLRTERFDECSLELVRHGALTQRQEQPVQRLPYLSPWWGLTYPKSTSRSPDLETQRPSRSYGLGSVTSKQIEAKGLNQVFRKVSSQSNAGASSKCGNSYKGLLAFEVTPSSSEEPLVSWTSTRDMQLMDMPSEIHLLIMQHVSISPLSLHWLRQTSATFMALFDDDQFEPFHVASESYSCHKSFDLSRLSRGELYLRSVRLLQHLHCSSCQESFRSGTLIEEWQKLHVVRYCVGCKENHRSFMFLPQDRERQDRCRGRLVCIGRQAEVSLCTHSNGSDAANRRTTWRDIEELAKRAQLSAGATEDHTRFCAHPSHETDSGMDWTWAIGFPRLIAHIDGSGPRSRVHIGYGWDLPLLWIHSSPPTLSAIKDSMSKLASEVLENQSRKICPHVFPNGEIRDFVQTGICECFRHDNNWGSEKGTNSPEDRKGSDAVKNDHTCRCGRRDFYRCRDCGAAYIWRFTDGYVSLSFRHSWYVKKPISVGWISQLDQRWRNRMFDEKSKHVLWCDTEGCRTNRCRPWEALL